LEALAERHVPYGVQPEHYPVVGQALIQTLATALGDAFTAEHKAAWGVVYGIIESVMVAAHKKMVVKEEESDWMGKLAAQQTAQLEEEKKASPAPEKQSKSEEGGLSSGQKALVQESWGKVTDAQVAGDLFYKTLFDLAPGVKPLFAKTDIKKQGVKTITTVGVAVKGLDDLASLVPVLEALAERHVPYGVQPEHYPVVGQALIQTLATALGDAFTAEHKAAWGAVYGIIESVMVAAHKKVVVDAQKRKEEEEKLAAQQTAQLEKEKEAKLSSPKAQKVSKYSWEAIAKHNTRNDCWIVIKEPFTNKPQIFDVTKFLPKHPGGRSVIMKYAGKDSTEEFFRIHSDSNYKLAQQYYLNDVQD